MLNKIVKFVITLLYPFRVIWRTKKPLFLKAEAILFKKYYY
jgi:hypothetical protein